jgi:hypothetical protein
MGTLLNIEYKSQSDSDAGLSRQDCGPACVAMLINAQTPLGQPVTTDAVFRRTGAPAEGYISVAQIMRAAESYQAALEFRKDCTLGQLRGWIDAARPPIALVHYGAFSEANNGAATQSSFRGPHFVLVVGYDDQNIIVHDPLWYGERRNEGAFKAWPIKVWLEAWGRCHEDCDAQRRCNPNFALMIPVRALPANRRTTVPADVVRRIRAKAAFEGVAQPKLTQPKTLARAQAALGAWGQQVKAHKVQPTDTLWRLAKAYYGDGNKMDVIRLFNGLTDTDVIHDGQILLIPEPTQSGVIPEDRKPVGSAPIK